MKCWILVFGMEPWWITSKKSCSSLRPGLQSLLAALDCDVNKSNVMADLLILFRASPLASINTCFLTVELCLFSAPLPSPLSSPPYLLQLCFYNNLHLSLFYPSVLVSDIFTIQPHVLCVSQPLIYILLTQPDNQTVFPFTSSQKSLTRLASHCG